MRNVTAALSALASAADAAGGIVHAPGLALSTTEWSVWLAANGQPGLKAAGSLRFKLYDQVIQAAVGGQGVALGRVPLIAEHLRDGRLTAPFPKRYDSARGYYAVVAPHATERPDVAAFVDWLSDEAAAEVRPSATGRRAAARASAGTRR